MLDAFFMYTPVFLIRLLWKEMDGYFKFNIPRRNEVVIDAGAWTGHFSLVAARLVGPKGKVVAIEPQKAMCDRLTQRFQRLGLKNITVVNVGLFDRTSELAVSKNPSPGFNVFEVVTQDKDSEKVSLRTLDETLAALGIQQVHFIKMDIEGAELEALAGARSLLSKMHPSIAIASYHLREGATTSSRVEKILSRFNYTVQTGHPIHLTTWGWYGPRPA
jgi:FkbM family methyltransferase